MRSAKPSRRALGLGVALAGLLGLLVLVPAAAQAAEAVRLKVLVVHTSDDAAGGIASDANAKKADSILGRQIRYKSLKVVDSDSSKVALNSTWTVSLPNGKKFRVSPIDVGANGVLVAVDLEGSAQVDARIKKNTPFVVGPQSHAGGNLSVILEASD